MQFSPGKLHFVLYGVSLFLYAACSNNEPIRIGFVAPLTRYSTELGTSGRNGAILAVEEINAQGGIYGHPLELTIRDVGGGPDSCERILGELLEAGHQYIVGPYTSNMAPAAMRAMKGKNALLLTPTMTTDMLEGLDDEILCVQPANHWTAERIIEHLVQTGLDSAVAVYDASNREYSQTLVESFRKTFTAMGGKVHQIDSIVPQVRSPSDVGQALAQVKTKAIYVATNGSQFATFAQTIRHGGQTAPLFAGTWAMTLETLSQGGRSVEGTIFSSPSPPANPEVSRNAFEIRFVERFGSPSNFASQESWEAVMALAQALRENPSGDPKQIQDDLLSREEIPGVYDNFRWNRFGDVVRPQTLVQIQNNRFVSIEK